MGNAIAASLSQARQILDAIAEDKQLLGGRKHQHSDSRFLGEAPATSKRGRELLKPNVEDGEFSKVISQWKRQEQQKAMVKVKATKELDL